MERINPNNPNLIKGYHTQEYRNEIYLRNPIRCAVEDAWLGNGYYFWTDVEFAKYWGEDFKLNETGFYTIYSAHLDTENCINTVFNEEHYFFFRKCLEKAIDFLNSKNKKITLKQVHTFLQDNFWSKLGIKGIIYDDLPSNPWDKPNRKYSVIKYKKNTNKPFFYYQKRIQIVIFDLKDIYFFEPFLDKQS